MVSVLTGFILFELFFIRTTLLNIYAEAITGHKVLLYFLRNRGINFFLSAVIALFLSFYLFIHINVASLSELGFFLISGVFLSLFLAPANKASKSILKKKPSKVVSRVVIVFIVVLITVFIDGLYNVFSPIDDRISQPFDINIPKYVIDDIEHSFIHLQHLLRTVMYFKFNIQSISLSEDVGVWFVLIRFLLLLSPTPYVAYALLFLSFSAIKKISFVTER